MYRVWVEIPEAIRKMFHSLRNLAWGNFEMDSGEVMTNVFHLDG